MSPGAELGGALESALDAELISGVLMLLRITSFVTSAPLLSARTVPMRARLGLAAVVTLAAASAAPHVDVPGEIGPLATLALFECCAGLAMGLVPRLIFEMASSAAQTAGLGAGLGFGAALDPINGAPSTAVGDLAMLAASGTALAAGLHRDLVAFVCRLAVLHPAGTLSSLEDLLSFAPGAILAAVVLSMRLSLISLAATSTAHLALGIIGRAVPQMGLSNLGFAAPLCVFGYIALTWLDVTVLQTLAATRDVLSAWGG